MRGFRRNTRVCLLKQSLKCGKCSAETGLKAKIRHACPCLHSGISSYAETRLFSCHDDVLFFLFVNNLICIHWSNNSERLRQNEVPRLLSMGAIH